MIWVGRLRMAARALALVGFGGLLVLAVMTTADVLMRWLFNAPLQGVNDVSAVVMAVVIAACIPANLAFKQNIKVEAVGLLGGDRLHGLLEVIASLATLVFILLMAWQFVPYVISLHETGDRTWVLGWQVWPWWAVASVMLCFAVLVQVMTLCVDVIDLLTGRAAAV
ncbi:TRAP-type C4-dicarboxylate transport system, small permease component [Marinibacterium anthonyi]|nr:TRAP-type C4-dicarboxylate transport system, small permease component [Marinibacterium anthonyi]